MGERGAQVKTFEAGSAENEEERKGKDGEGIGRRSRAKEDRKSGGTEAGINLGTCQDEDGSGA